MILTQNNDNDNFSRYLDICDLSLVPGFAIDNTYASSELPYHCT